MKAFDFLGNKLNVGNEVVFFALKYRCLTKGKITKITEKMIFIDFINTWNYGKDNVRVDNCKQYHNQVIKIVE